jgi:hypothetical protein
MEQNEHFAAEATPVPLEAWLQSSFGISKPLLVEKANLLPNVTLS